MKHARWRGTIYRSESSREDTFQSKYCRARAFIWTLISTFIIPNSQKMTLRPKPPLHFILNILFHFLIRLRDQIHSILLLFHHLWPRVIVVILVCSSCLCPPRFLTISDHLRGFGGDLDGCFEPTVEIG